MSRVTEAIQKYEQQYGSFNIDDLIVEYANIEGSPIFYMKDSIKWYISIEKIRLNTIRVLCENFDDFYEKVLSKLDIDFDTLDKEELLEIVDKIGVVPYNHDNYQLFDIKVKLLEKTNIEMSFTNEEIDRIYEMIVNGELKMTYGFGRLHDLMLKLCELDGSYLNYAIGKSLSEDVAEVAISHGYVIDDKIHDNYLGYSFSIMKKLCELDGNNIKYALPDALTSDLIKISFEHGFNFENPTMSYTMRGNLELMKIMCAKDPKFLNAASTEIITEELVKIALDNGFNIEENLSYDLKKSPVAMKIFCEIDGNNLKYANGEIVSLELFEIALAHGYDIEQNLRYSYGVCQNKDIMKRLCEKDGKYLQFVGAEALSIELIEIAMAHGYNPDKQLKYSYCLTRNLEAMEYFCKLDGKYLQYVSIHTITEELFDLGLANGYNPDEQLPETSAIYDNISLMKKLCRMNGKYLENIGVQSLMEKDDDGNYIFHGEIIDIALNNSDPNKRFDSSTQLEHLFNEVIKYVSISIHDEYKELPSLMCDAFYKADIKNIAYIPSNLLTNEAIERAMQNREVNTNADIQEKILNHFSELMTRYKEPLYQTMIENVCRKHNITKEFFENILEQAWLINDEFSTTLDFELLEERYAELYKEDNYEKLYVLGTYPDVQQQIISIGNPKNLDTNVVDKRLGNKRLDLLNLLLKQSIKREDGAKEENWIPYYAKIITALSENPSMYDQLLDKELTEDELQQLTIHTLGKHKYEINTLDDLDRYDEIKNNYIENIMSSSSDIDEIRDALFEKIFGISLETAKELYIPYVYLVHENLEIFKLLENNNISKYIYSFFYALDKIMSAKDISVLKSITIPQSIKLEPDDILNMRTVFKSVIVADYNKSLFSIDGKKPSTNLDDVEIFKAAGEDGKDEFDLSISALGAYSEFDPNADGFNYKEDWNRPKVASHGICTSYIGNNNLGTARIKYSVLGFTDYESDSLLLGSNQDIVSRKANVIFDTSIGEVGERVEHPSRYFSSKGMKDFTRHTHNEVVFERRLKENRKRQPSYVVFFCDDYESALAEYQRIIEENDQESISKTHSDEEDEVKVVTKDGVHLIDAMQTARDFGIPIVVVERKKIAKNEKDKIDTCLELFKSLPEDVITEDLVQEYLYKILVQHENNHAGSRDYHENIDIEYFGNDRFLELFSEISQKISTIKSKEKREILTTLLEECINKERRKYELGGIDQHNKDEIVKFKIALDRCRLMIIEEQMNEQVSIYEQQYLSEEEEVINNGPTR